MAQHFRGFCGNTANAVFPAGSPEGHALPYLQNYNPLNHGWLSTLAAATPVLVLLSLLALHPTKRNDGSIHKGIAAHYAAAIAVVVALCLALFVFHMPARTAAMSMVYGGMYGLFP